jgi:Outer membrane protein beta-barrel domain
MKKILTTAVLLAITIPIFADDWSLGVHSGPFVFGDFLERKVRPAGGGPTGGTVTMSLSADTRAGFAVDVQRDFSERWGARLEATFSRGPLSIREEGDDAIVLDAGELNVTTVTLPVVFRINPKGTFRFHLMGGPAYAMYEFQPAAGSGGISVISSTENEWGLALGGGVGWWFSDRFALEGTITDIVTTSPFDRSDFPDVPGYSIPKPHNVHTTAGLRWKF